MCDDVVVDHKAYVALAFGESFDEGVARERSIEDTAIGKEGVEVGPTLDGRHGSHHKLNSSSLGLGCELFGSTNGLTF